MVHCLPYAGQTASATEGGNDNDEEADEDGDDLISVISTDAKGAKVNHLLHFLGNTKYWHSISCMFSVFLLVAMLFAPYLSYEDKFNVV